ncbi:MAG: hypothetical protein DRO40_08875 [Thermoprotei archaeon]|nr:MAG: hypothetical protein DRO40_08875 [Thermoprotei archaeon]
MSFLEKLDHLLNKKNNKENNKKREEGPRQRKKSTVESTVEKTRGKGRMTAWVFGVFYEIMTGKSIRGSRGRILEGLLIELLKFAKENEPGAYRNIINRIKSGEL